MQYNYGVDPGMQPKVESSESQICWGHEVFRIFDPLGKIASTATDSGSSPSSLLRAGLIMAKNSSDLWVPWAADAGDVTSEPKGILFRAISMLNPLTFAAESKNQLILIGGLVKASSVLNLDARVRSQLSNRFFFDDEPLYSGVPSGFLGGSRRVITKAADYTVVAGDSGTLFVATAAVNFTLPTKANGLAFEFVQTADANMAILSAGSADDIIVDGDAGADSVTFSTSSHKIGSRIRVECVYTAASTLKWIVANVGGTTMTIA